MAEPGPGAPAEPGRAIAPSPPSESAPREARGIDGVDPSPSRTQTPLRLAHPAPPGHRPGQGPLPETPTPAGDAPPRPGAGPGPGAEPEPAVVIGEIRVVTPPAAPPPVNPLASLAALRTGASRHRGGSRWRA